jgi:starch phosphorylase
VLSDFAEMFPSRFNNKTNGVTPRRWLQQANPFLSRLITQQIGQQWVGDLAQLRKLLPMADDSGFREQFRIAKRSAKTAFANWLKATLGQSVDPDSIFDSQIKRIHEYKRQLLNVLHIITLYNRLRLDPKQELTPHTFFFAGKAAPAYQLAKLIVKLINNVAGTINTDPVVRGRLKVLFLPEYNVSMAERLIPASDVSEQISTAGFEASGTGNMKFMMNGALTIGTRDGATIEMAQETGEENFFLFGLTAAGSFQPDPRHLVDPRRSLSASRRPDRLRACPSGPGRAVRRPPGLGKEGNHQRGLFRAIFQRSNHHRVRERDLEPEALAGAVIAWSCPGPRH